MAGEPNHGIGNAGLVLLWPFLTHYFDALGMLDRTQFRTADDRARAPYLLQLLASGDMEATDERILLNKILCGIDGAEALPNPEPAREAEVTLAGQLLGSVTQHWSKLENTTAAGLRETFLMREGMLTKHGSHWKLAVTRKTVDVLLQTLPWERSIVGLPWMQGPLYVEWEA